MIEFQPDIRNAARALICRGNQVLLLKKLGGRFALPGGGQDCGESLEQALVRECWEELGTEVTVGALLQVADYFKIRDTEPPSRRHLLEFLFRCEVDSDYQAQMGPRPDRSQIEVLWVDSDKLAGLNLFPSFLRDSIPGLNQAQHTIYLGQFSDDASD